MTLRTLVRKATPRAAGFLVFCVLAAGATGAHAQVGAGQITGTVTDASGAAVQDAEIAAIHVDSAGERRTRSSSEGLFTLSGLSPGLYRVEVRAAGFRITRRDGIRIETGETVQIELGLVVGEVGEEVVVSGDAPFMRTTGSLGQVVSEEKIVSLPLNGRSFITLAGLVPGVALPPGSQLPRINGGRPRTNEYLFDGVSVLQPEPGQVAFFPIIDAIQEFKIETNSPPAEFGRFNGGVINLTMKSGSNELRGTVWEFFRHESLNARNYFANAETDQLAFRRNQFGGAVGGPLVRNRTFFFADYQGHRQRVGRIVFSVVPTELQRSGIFTESIDGSVPVIYDPATTAPNGSGGFTRTPFANQQIPTERLDPVALSLLQRYPHPTSPGTTNNFRRTADEIDEQDQWDVRVDHRFTDRANAFARLSNFRGRVTPVTPLPEGSGVTTGTLGPQDTVAWAFAANYRHTLSPTMLNEVRVGDTRRSVDRLATELPGSAGDALGLPGIPSGAQFPNTLPTFLVSGYQQLGSPPNTASRFSTSVTQVADTLTWVKGRHTLKMGLDWRWERLDVIQPPSPTGSFSFNAIGSDLPGVTGTGTPFASFLLGQVQSFSIDLQRSEIRERARFQEYFVQDDWRVSDRLTINPGLRYTLNFPSTEINGQTAVFNLQTQMLEYPGDQPVRQLQKGNFGPRLGIVYRPTDPMIVSVGYGLVWIEMAGITTPFTTPSFPFLETVSQRALDNVNPAFVLENGPSVESVGTTPTAGLGQGVFSVDADLGSGYVQQWNLAVQRQLGANINIEVAYVGSKITHVGIPDTNLNQLTVEQLATGPALLERVPNPYFGSIPRSSSLGDPTITRAQLFKPYPQYTTVSLYRNNVGNTNYHGLTMKLEQRVSRGLSYLVSYTRSRLMDDASAVFDASILTGPVANYPVADSHNRGLERDYSTGDIPHVFVTSAVWDLPWGTGRAREPGGWLGALVNDWTVATIVTLQSGTPIAVTQATNFNAFAGFGTQRPNLVGDPELPGDERTTARWFNTAAFQVAPQFTLGSASRNPVRGPAYRNVDVVFSRRVLTGGGTALEFRAEIFNALNTPAWGNPAGVLGTASFGTITTAGDPRVVQFALKLLF
jgi:hypothetical protein